MERRSTERNWIRWIVLGVLTVALMSGHFLAGVFLAARLCDRLPPSGKMDVTLPLVPLEASLVSTPASVSPSTLRDTDTDEHVVAGVYERVAPTVVHIRVVQHWFGMTLPMTETIQIPGRSCLDSPHQPQVFHCQSVGSGFVWDDNGHIVTNYHVVEGAEKIEVSFLDGATLPVRVVGSDPDSDLVVLQVDLAADRLRPARLGDSDAVFVGQRVIAIGNPFGQEWTLTTGVVSALRRATHSGACEFSLPEMIQTDAALNPGNSGGPLLDWQGQVIGVNTMILSRNQTSTGVGFAIPVNVVKRIVPALIQEGHYTFAWLGLSGRDLDQETAIAMDLPSDQRGALVAEVTDGSPASKVGLRGSAKTVTLDGAEVRIGGDVIIAIDGQPVRTMADLTVHLVQEAQPGQKIALTLLRRGEERRVEVMLGERPR